MTNIESKNYERPKLTVGLDPLIFKSYYWLKKELLKFCREQGLRTVGSKIEITQRIAAYLQNGKVPERTASNIRRNRQLNKSNEELTLDTIITPLYKSDEKHRKFFKAVIGPQFHFTTAFMRYFRQNIGKTYAEAVDFWHKEKAEARKDKRDSTEIAPQFEYNQFMRDFRQANPGKSFKEAIEAWKIVRQQPGSRKYSS